METSAPAKKKVPVNMRLVAQKAGVSVTTVSLALRNDSSISQETKERIYAIQRELGYRVKPRLRNSASASAPKLEKIIYRVEGVRLDEKSYAPFLNGIIEECREQRIKLELDHAGSEDVEHFLANRDLTNSGVILSGRLKETHIEQIQKSGVPFIVLGNYRFARPVHLVGIDLLDLAETIVSEIQRKGYESLLIVLERFEMPFEKRFFGLIRGLMGEAGLPTDGIIIEAGTDSSDIAEAAQKVVALNQPRQAILTSANCADHLAMELRLGAKKAKHAVEIFALAQSLRGSSKRHYHSIDLGHQQCGRLAVVRLAELIANPTMPPHQSLIDPVRSL